jgi:acyl-CoA thioester hydrolase
MSKIFVKEFAVGWGDLDGNAHMRNTAYLDAAATTRFSFFSDNGFSVARFHELQLGPVVLKDEVRFFKEMRLLDKFNVGFLLDGMNADGSLFRLVNEVTRADGVKSAVVTTQGAWFDLVKRKIMPPPPELLAVMKQLEKTAGYEEIKGKL